MGSKYGSPGTAGKSYTAPPKPPAGRDGRRESIELTDDTDDQRQDSRCRQDTMVRLSTLLAVCGGSMLTDCLAFVG